MKKKVSLQARVKQEKESSEKFEQGFRVGELTLASLVAPQKVPLTTEQNQQIKTLFSEYKPEELLEARLQKDISEVLELSAMIKSITQQSVLLVGERVKKAQAVMLSYRGGMFNKWLFMVFGNKVTPYSFLNYYNLYHSIDDQHTRGLLEEMPKKAAYKLASRKGDLVEKIEILNAVTESRSQKKNIKNTALEKIIDQRLPVDATDMRSVASLKRNPQKARLVVLKYISEILEFKALLEPKHFSREDKSRLLELLDALMAWSAPGED